MNPTEPGVAAIDPIPVGDPYDMKAEAAGQEMWTFAQEWRARHGLTDIQYLWIVGRMMQEQLRAMSADDQAAYHRQIGYTPSSG